MATYSLCDDTLEHPTGHLHTRTISSNFPHTRTASSNTLHTITTDLSHTTEPLLNSTNSGSLTYQGFLAAQSVDEDGEQWDHTGLSLDGLSPTFKETQSFESARKRLQFLKLTGYVLKFILGVWALYNTIRYFIAYTIYDSTQGQIAALVLGTSTAMCLALFVCAAILSTSLIRAHIPIRSLLLLRGILHFLAFFFLVSPSLANLALTIVWRKSSVVELVPELRCRLDVDVVWSITAGTCNRTTVAQWLGLSIFRAVLTLFLAVMYLLISYTFIGTRQPFQRRRHRRLRMPPENSIAVSPPPLSASSKAPLSPARLSKHPSRSTMTSQGNHRTPDHSLRGSVSSVFHASLSDDDDGEHNTELQMQQRSGIHFPSTDSQSDRELYNFADRFRAIVSQISLEADEALQFAQPDRVDHEPALLSNDTYTSFPPYPYDEFGYPPDEHVRILNGFVRRMPTIESLGSHELTSIASTHDRFTSPSRPPTRSEFTGSDPPSRANSLSLAAAIGGFGLKSSEMGELMDQVEKANSINTGTSRSMSYHTAQSNGSASASPIAESPSSWSRSF